jgi:hypothetical protein
LKLSAPFRCSAKPRNHGDFKPVGALELMIYPVIYAVWKGWREVRSTTKHGTVPVTATARIRTER